MTLRNAIHRRLAYRYGEAWYDNPDAGLDRGAVERIASTRMELARHGHDEGPPRIVAALSFGFWVSLLGPGGRVAAGRKADYVMTLWRPALRGAFAHHATLTRKEAHRPLNNLRTLRNRSAHHEPVFARDLARDHERIVEVLGWMTPGARRWIEHLGLNDPDVNFRGLTVSVRLPSVEAVRGPRWTVAADIVDCPELELVLPARKETVETAFLDEMREPVGGDALLMACDPEPPEAQALWRVAERGGIPGRLFEPDRRLEGYAWYDAIEHIAAIYTEATVGRRAHAFDRYPVPERNGAPEAPLPQRPYSRRMRG